MEAEPSPELQNATEWPISQFALCQRDYVEEEWEVSSRDLFMYFNLGGGGMGSCETVQS